MTMRTGAKEHRPKVSGAIKLLKLLNSTMPYAVRKMRANEPDFIFRVSFDAQNSERVSSERGGM